MICTVCEAHDARIDPSDGVRRWIRLKDEDVVTCSMECMGLALQVGVPQARYLVFLFTSDTYHDDGGGHIEPSREVLVATD
jgi:hypothetical protein